MANVRSEFLPYVFQIFSAILELDPEGPVPDNFKTLIVPILETTPWETKGNVPALARFLSAAIPKLRQEIVGQQQLEKILILFQMLHGTKRTTGDAFKVLEAVVSSLDA